MIGDSEAGLLLSDRFVSILTPDLCEARPAIERLQGPYDARPRQSGGSRREPVQVRAALCGHIGLSTFRFGTKIDIRPQGLAGAILVTTAVRGRAGMAHGDRMFGAAPGATFIAQEEDHPTFLYQPDTEVLKLRFERSRVEELCVKVYDWLPGTPLKFDASMSLPHAATRWAALLRYVVSRVNAPAEMQPNVFETASMEELLMLTLLSIQPHNCHARYGAKLRSVSPRQYRLAVDYINQHLKADITLPDIAEAAGCSMRSLARAFQHASDTSPMQYVQRLRLQRIKAELIQARSGERTIADIAYHWGCRHLGEFNRKYRECFGETPSETRHRSPGWF